MSGDGPAAGRRTAVWMHGSKGQRKLVLSTAYDAWMAALVDPYVDGILVGDSLGVVVQGHETTLPVTLDEMVYHVRAVTRVARRALVIADLPFLSYQASLDDSLRAAGRCLKEGGAQAVKLEGGWPVADRVEALVGVGIPVAGHLGLRPQAVHTLGGMEEQGGTPAAARALLDDARALDEAGVFLLVLERVPAELARRVTETVSAPSVGIGAGPDCDGQIQVFHDLFRLREPVVPGLATPRCDAGKMMRDALRSWAEDVRGDAPA